MNEPFPDLAAHLAYEHHFAAAEIDDRPHSHEEPV